MTLSKKSQRSGWDKDTLNTFFKLLGLDLRTLMITKEGRAMVQDLVYLATASGIETGYTFQWYSGHRGL